MLDDIPAEERKAMWGRVEGLPAPRAYAGGAAVVDAAPGRGVFGDAVRTPLRTSPGVALLCHGVAVLCRVD